MELDKQDLKVANILHELDQSTLNEIKHFQKKYVGRYVTITRDWRKGAKGSRAVIDSVIFSDGRILFLCMAVNSKNEKINGDAWTREFRPCEDFELIGEEQP